MNQKTNKYILENSELMYKTLKELCLIPAPSHFEGVGQTTVKGGLKILALKVYILMRH